MLIISEIFIVVYQFCSHIFYYLFSFVPIPAQNFLLLAKYITKSDANTYRGKRSGIQNVFAFTYVILLASIFFLRIN